MQRRLLDKSFQFLLGEVKRVMEDLESIFKSLRGCSDSDIILRRDELPQISTEFGFLAGRVSPSCIN